MRRARLSTLLIGVNAGLVLLAVVCVVFAAMGLLRRLADQQALARVELGGRAALEAVERSAQDVHTSALALDRSFVERVSAQVGLPVAVVSAAEAAERTDDPRYLLRDQALSTGQPASGRLEDAYVSIVPIPPENTALVETSLPTQPIASSLHGLVRTLLLLSLW
ncbi:MAG TPA: hypothetical protein VKM72_22685, partial [Thermoanaerobaculia bacterium]|nr:hypothetical protein [Thermoanaerobaculia bacterium]